MKRLTRISMPSILTVLLMLSTSGMSYARTSAGITGSTNVHLSANIVAQADSIYSSIHRKAAEPREGCKPERNPNVPSAAFTVFEYLLEHNYSPPKGYKGNTPYGNTSHKLPDPPKGYRWFEYDVYSGSYSRSPDRIVTVRNGKIQYSGYPYFSPDHYDTFVPMYFCPGGIKPPGGTKMTSASFM